MKKRNLIVCTLLTMTLAANLILPVMAEETTTTQSEGAPAGMQDGGTPPEKPSGAPSGEAPSGAPDGQGGPGAGETPPDMPSGEAPSGEMPGGPGEMGGPGGMGGQESVTYTAVNEVTEGSQEFSGALESTGTDENVILVSGQDAAARKSAYSRLSCGRPWRA